MLLSFFTIHLIRRNKSTYVLSCLTDRHDVNQNDVFVQMMYGFAFASNYVHVNSHDAVALNQITPNHIQMKNNLLLLLLLPKFTMLKTMY